MSSSTEDSELVSDVLQGKYCMPFIKTTEDCRYFILIPCRFTSLSFLLQGYQRFGGKYSPFFRVLKEKFGKKTLYVKRNRSRPVVNLRFPKLLSFYPEDSSLGEFSPITKFLAAFAVLQACAFSVYKKKTE